MLEPDVEGVDKLQTKGKGLSGSKGTEVGVTVHGRPLTAGGRYGLGASSPSCLKRPLG